MVKWCSAKHKGCMHAFRESTISYDCIARAAINECMYMSVRTPHN